MPDERQDSIRKGIHAPAESREGTAAERERVQRLSQDPAIDGAMGGTSDESRAGDEALMKAARAEPEATTGRRVTPASAGGSGDAADVVRATREASQRAQGGGSAEERDIDRAAREDDLTS